MSFLVKSTGPRFCNQGYSGIPKPTSHIGIKSLTSATRRNPTTDFSSYTIKRPLFEMYANRALGTAKKIHEIQVPKNLGLMNVIQALFTRATWMPRTNDYWDKQVTEECLRQRLVISPYLEVFDGKALNVDFTKFPNTIEVSGFNELYGPDAAEETLGRESVKKASEKVSVATLEKDTAEKTLPKEEVLRTFIERDEQALGVVKKDVSIAEKKKDAPEQTMSVKALINPFSALIKNDISP